MTHLIKPRRILAVMILLLTYVLGNASGIYRVLYRGNGMFCAAQKCWIVYQITEDEQ